MNLEESDAFIEELEKTSRKKKLVVVSIILCALLIVLLIGLIITIQYQDSITEKFFLNGTQIAKPENVYLDVEGKVYVDIEAFVDLLKSSQSSTIKYTYNQGTYSLYDEDEKSCFIDNGYETIAITADNNYYYKYTNQQGPDGSNISGIEAVLKSGYGYSEKFNIEDQIRFIDNKIYVPLESIPEMFNLRLEWGEYRKRIYTFETVVASAQEELSKLGTNQVLNSYYENLKSIIYGYVILQEPDGKNYGVYSLADGTSLLSSIYQDITFVQNVQEFYVTASNGTMGLVSAEGDTIIKPSEYNKISALDDDNKLYEVEKNKEYGVISRLGKPIIHAEYDAIGIDVSKFKLDNIDNEKLLAEKCIPVEKNKKYGLYNIDGEQILNESYDGFGYISASTTSRAGDEESILMIPKSEGVNGIIVNQGDLYGIFDIDDETLFLPCSFTKIFAVRKSGQIHYYIEFNGTQYELKSYLEELGIAKQYDLLEEDTESEENSENSENENTIANTVEENNTEETENSDETVVEVEL